MSRMVVLLASFFLLFALVGSGSPVNPTFEIVAYFEKSEDFGTSLSTFERVYADVLRYPQSDDNVPRAYNRNNCDGVPESFASKCTRAVGYTNTDGDLMTQLSRKVQDDSANLIQMVLERNADFGMIRIGAMAVVPLYTSDPSKNNGDNDDSAKGFFAKYPYVIAIVAIVVVIAIIVAAVFLIQKRANAMAEMDDESMLAEGEAPGYVPHTNGRGAQQRRNENKNRYEAPPTRGGENEAVVITSSDGTVIGGGGAAGAAAGNNSEGAKEASDVAPVTMEDQ